MAREIDTVYGIAMPLSLDSIPAKEVLSETLVPSSIWKFLCILLIIVNFKNLPLVWHVSLPTAPWMWKLVLLGNEGSTLECFSVRASF